MLICLSAKFEQKAQSVNALRKMYRQGPDQSGSLKMENYGKYFRAEWFQYDL